MPAASVAAFARRTGRPVASVEKLWNKAKDLAAKAGRKDDFAYITGILKRMLRIETEESGEGKTSPDSLLLLEVWGPDYTAKLLSEAMPGGVKASLAMRWLEVEKQLRNIPSGTVNWNILARSMRQALYTLLGWLAGDKTEDRFKKFTGII